MKTPFSSFASDFVAVAMRATLAERDGDLESVFSLRVSATCLTFVFTISLVQSYVILRVGFKTNMTLQISITMTSATSTKPRRWQADADAARYLSRYYRT